MPTATAAPISLHYGAVPTIALFNHATKPLGIAFTTLFRTMQKYVDQHVAPVWGKRADLVRSGGYLKGAWALVLLDSPDDPFAQAHHDLTPDGLPQAKLFVRPTLASGEDVSVALSHELVELLVDPALNLIALGPDPRVMYAVECADPVEGQRFGVDGVPVSNFVYPSYFEPFHAAGAVPFDHLHKVPSPFHITASGHQAIRAAGGWTQRFGSADRAQLFAADDRSGQRTEQRSYRAVLKRADPGAMRRSA